MNLISVKSLPPLFYFIAEKTTANYLLLQKRLLRICFFNFLLLSLAGLLLRAYPIASVPFFTYKNVLHAHSHFAFGGWVVPVLLYLVLKFFPEISKPSLYPHWRNVVVLTIVSAYGMLFSFPFQGYGGVSIVFSTLSIAAGCYAGLLIRSAIRRQFFQASAAFLLAGFFYFFISAIGPFATGPLIAMGKAGTPIYYNAIYFYLHFQYNGFFTFILLAVLYKMIEQTKPFNNGKRVFTFLNIACAPAYALSVLWTQPPAIVNIAGGSAALLQLVGVTFLLQDFRGKARWKMGNQRWLFRLAIFALVLKSLLQLFSAFPAVATLAYQNRNFIIAYLHLVLIGFISLFAFAAILKAGSSFSHGLQKAGIRLFLFAFITTELLLVLQASGCLNFLHPSIYVHLLFGLSIFFPAGLLMIFIAQQPRSVLQRKFQN